MASSKKCGLLRLADSNIYKHKLASIPVTFLQVSPFILWQSSGGNSCHSSNRLHVASRIDTSNQNKSHETCTVLASWPHSKPWLDITCLTGPSGTLCEKCDANVSVRTLCIYVHAHTYKGNAACFVCHAKMSTTHF